METFLVGRLGNAQLKKKYKGAYVFKSFIYNNSLYVTNLPSWKTLHCIAVFDIKKKITSSNFSYINIWVHLIKKKTFDPCPWPIPFNIYLKFLCMNRCAYMCMLKWIWNNTSQSPNCAWYTRGTCNVLYT